MDYHGRVNRSESFEGDLKDEGMDVGGACMLHPANGRRPWCRRQLLRYIAEFQACLSATGSSKHPSSQAGEMNGSFQ